MYNGEDRIHVKIQKLIPVAQYDPRMPLPLNNLKF